MYVQKIPWEANYDESQMPAYTLPDPLICQDGSAVRSADEWTKKRRGELLQMFKNEIYGELPPRSDHGGISDYPTWRFGLVQLLLAAKPSVPVWNKSGFARSGNSVFL